MQKTKRDNGIVGNFFVAAYQSVANAVKAWNKRRYNKRLFKLIKKAEDHRRLTGYRYLIIRFRGRMRLIQKQELKRWIANGTFKRGTTIQDIEKKALYETKLSPKYS